MKIEGYIKTIEINVCDIDKCCITIEPTETYAFRKDSDGHVLSMVCEDSSGAKIVDAKAKIFVRGLCVYRRNMMLLELKNHRSKMEFELTPSENNNKEMREGESYSLLKFTVL